MSLCKYCESSSVGRAQPCQGWGREFESRLPLKLKKSARMVELVDTPDLKSCACMGVRVQVPLRVQSGTNWKFLHLYRFFFALKMQKYWHILSNRLDPTTKVQLRRASFSIVLNLAEGSGRFSKPDRRNFFVISRSSIFECVAILDILHNTQTIENE
jgi:four helix bundle protein